MSQCHNGASPRNKRIHYNWEARVHKQELADMMGFVYSSVFVGEEKMISVV